MKTRRGFLAAAGGLFSGLAVPSVAQAWGFRRRQVVCPPPPCAPAPFAPPVNYGIRTPETTCWMCVAPDYCYLFYGGVYYYEGCICPTCSFIVDASSDKDLAHCDDCSTCSSDMGLSSCETDNCICVGDNSRYERSKKKLFPGRVQPASALSKRGIPDLPPDTMPTTTLPAGHKASTPPADVSVTVENVRTICYPSPFGNHRPIVIRGCTVRITSNTLAHMPRTLHMGLELTGIDCNAADVKGKGVWLPAHGKRHHLVGDDPDPGKAKIFYDVITRNVD